MHIIFARCATLIRKLCAELCVTVILLNSTIPHHTAPKKIRQPTDRIGANIHDNRVGIYLQYRRLVEWQDGLHCDRLRPGHDGCPFQR